MRSLRVVDRPGDNGHRIPSVYSWDAIGDAEASQAYLDLYTGLGSAVWLLESGCFDVRNFLELCNVLEAVVLYDRLFVTPNPCPPRGSLDPLSKLLVQEDVLRLVEIPSLPAVDKEIPTPDEVAWRRRGSKVRRELRKQNRVEFVDIFFGLGANVIHGLHLHPSVYNRAAYYEGLEVKDSLLATYSILAAYEKLATAARRDHEAVSRFRGVETIFIPPIPAIILSKISKPEELGEELLSVRVKLKRVRSAFREYEALLRDDSLPLSKSLDAQKALKSVLEDVSRPFDAKGLSVLTEWKDVSEIVPVDADFDADDAKSLTKFLLGKPLEALAKTLRRRKFLQLYSLRSQYFQISGLNRIINRLWGHDVDAEDEAVAEQYVRIPDAETFHLSGTDVVVPPRQHGFEIWKSPKEDESDNGV